MKIHTMDLMNVLLTCYPSVFRDSPESIMFRSDSVSGMNENVMTFLYKRGLYVVSLHEILGGEAYEVALIKPDGSCSFAKYENPSTTQVGNFNVVVASANRYTHAWNINKIQISENGKLFRLYPEEGKEICVTKVYGHYPTYSSAFEKYKEYNVLAGDDKKINIFNDD